MYFKVEISAETTEQVDTILDDLLDKRLVTGGQIIGTPSRFLWKGEVENMQYYTITSYTTEANRSAVIAAVEKTSVEEFPMICFFSMEVNDKLAEWISTTVAQ